MNKKLPKEIRKNIELILLEYLNNENYLNYDSYNYIEQKIFYGKGKNDELI